MRRARRSSCPPTRNRSSRAARATCSAEQPRNRRIQRQIVTYPPRCDGTIRRRPQWVARTLGAIRASTCTKGSIMSAETFRRTPFRLLLPIVALGAIAGLFWAGTRRARARDEHRPADVGFMRAMHDALRRDMTRLRSVAPRLEGAADSMPRVREGWG